MLGARRLVFEEKTVVGTPQEHDYLPHREA